MTDENSERHLKFEEVLRYADFPSLDLPPWDTNVQKPGREIFGALTWLRRTKGVKRIMALRVLDRMYYPHDEKFIAMKARELEVANLDWRYLDMAISYLSDPHLYNSAEELVVPPERLTELHLYSSGKRAAVDHWIGKNGVRVLKKVSECGIDFRYSQISSDEWAVKLKTLYIHFIQVRLLLSPRMSITLLTTAGQDLTTAGRIKDLKTIIEIGIKEINATRAENEKIEDEYLEQRWNSTPRNNTENLKEM
jgi:hypothetical protein